MVEVNRNLFAAVIAALTYASYKAYLTGNGWMSWLPVYVAALDKSSLYCTTAPGRVYTSTEDEFSRVPDTATCFEVSADGVFGAVWKERNDVPEARRGKIMDVDGWVMPGFWDGHGHIVDYGKMEEGVILYNQNMPEVINSILAYAEAHPTYGSRDHWIQGTGWDQAYFGGKMPTAEQLAHPMLSDLYIYVTRVDVHCVWVSNAVLRLLPSPLPAAPPGGEIPTEGVFCDNAMDLILPLMPPTTEKDIETYIKTAVPSLHKVGLVGVMDAATAINEVPVYKRLAETGKLGMRVYGMVECAKRNTFCEVDKINVVKKEDTFILRAVKLFADGALGSWGAALIEPYEDKPTRGTMLINSTELAKVATQWFSNDWQVNIHAIGDAANRAALNAFETAMLLHPDMAEDRRLRLEHAQIINPEDQPRLHSLKVIASIQPTHATSDMAYAITRLGDDRTRHSAYRMKSLFPTREHPERLLPIFGSDFPVEPAAPLHGMYAATTRCNPNKDTCERDALWEEEKVGRIDAVRGFGRNAGHGGWLENYGVGKIQSGGWADWVVLDKDFYDEGVDLRRIDVLETWIGGRRVWSSKEGEEEDVGVKVQQGMAGDW
ncbi:hypothetical protein H072_6701 [Dactylellina haptotyla CBS 200.50]|uniref:Amidohydrolase 3 domain-containing protein n=1 Tax=Dactylellina haptotyla (strain CBS 200.50) TaxID=1284197 RepID=S8AEC6_DACHA|nr:hypothetical protein H072_6701 [Dactylellina haptotyla CBS 200.50]